MSDDRQKRIERRAYEIWDREGRPSGLDTENWRRAEEEIAREEAEANPPEARPAEAEAEAEVEAKPAPEAKPERTTNAKPAAKAKPAEPEPASPASKPAEKAGASGSETQEKGTRKRKTASKKK